MPYHDIYQTVECEECSKRLSVLLDICGNSHTSRKVSNLFLSKGQSLTWQGRLNGTVKLFWPTFRPPLYSQWTFLVHVKRCSIMPAIIGGSSEVVGLWKMTLRATAAPEFRSTPFQLRHTRAICHRTVNIRVTRWRATFSYELCAKIVNVRIRAIWCYNKLHFMWSWGSKLLRNMFPRQ